ncbi:glycosyltransferase [Actinoplanes sp. SE50]|uniref:glycosyltransferase n=1 Tax=unclassified Actinoplanes TaxID=2626549 RepID=UPI00023EBD25|nr:MULTISPECIES: glycosyltransferase [unclassified Actinoplanes]AEV84002.1 glycosyl transferase family protein [Actinoplanes sp. SE50/110]ATO82395.1 glycosyltransferase [Actinoplanes sp. SE50]SLL99802.1 glycosyl transferase [Actinoplanes sp. SE50/110]
MTSVVIAAHNEAAVLGRCLDTLLADARPGEFDVTVVANGCTDDTAAVARSRGVRVIELPEPGKPGALNAADEVAAGFPRVYLDADIMLTTSGLRDLAAACASTPAATARRELDLSGRPLPVRAYFSVHRHLPALRTGLFGRGVIALSGSGRARFTRFPDMVADDLFVDSLFTTDEKQQVASVASVVATPRHTRDLIRRLIRVRAGNAAMRAAAARGEIQAAVRPSGRSSWLKDVVLRRPWLAPAAVCYVAITVYAAVQARRRPDTEWGRDASTRESASA